MYHRCITVKTWECYSCGAHGTYVSQNEIEEIDDDDASVAGDGCEHPWQGIDFVDDLMGEF
jgi:hypothetical protein